MAKNLVIVESPAKVKTIKKFLGKNYEVVASNGHVRDLPKSSMGIDFEHDYEPKYITIRGKGDIVANLRKEVKKADRVYLATDPDREGEAISWHLAQALKLEDKKFSRITFNEITKNAVKESLKNARDIDMDLVNAQQTRRIIDRMVGYKISPLLWKKVKRGLSAGRVQSVALRLICDREDEVNAFVPKEYWTLEGSFKAAGEKKELVAKYVGTDKEKAEIGSKAELDKILKDLDKAEYSIADVKKSERIRKQPLPFTTSTLQQEASKVLNYAPSKTMRLAQTLYEGIDIKGQGTVALITYLRTDSTRISDVAKEEAAKYITDNFGKEYLGQGAETKAAGNKKVQDAHEAIRPTSTERTPASLKDLMPRDLFRLYQLIWKRFVASQMGPAKYETTSVKIGAGRHRFSVASSRVVFDGFLSVYSDEKEDMGASNALVKALKKGDKMELVSFEEKQHFTQPPAHYTEASLIKELEELGIGRPSTYAPTISTIVARRYVIKENKNLFVTELGEAVNDIMCQSFSSIVNVNFTANIELLLDNIGEGVIEWKTVVSNFYPDLESAVDVAEKELEKVEIHDEVSEEICELCGRNMVIKYGPHGKFLACPGFPECKNAKTYLEKIGVQCPQCGKELVVRRTKKGRRFYGCENNPECDYMTWQKPKTNN